MIGREFDVPREKNESIELSDEMLRARFIEEENRKRQLDEKFLRELIKLDAVKNYEKSKSKSIKSKPKKNNRSSNKPAVAHLQKEL